ncbi:MAG: cardiolipin synthase [Lachnospiraceae bacterium]|nr:cardiolipin synthase [Lachnospiraceae bacterium]
MKNKTKNIFWKVAFSRAMVTILLVLLQLFVTVIGFLWLGQYFPYLLYGMAIVGYMLVIFIINSDDNPNFKLTWIIPICIFPMLGALLYLYIHLNVGSIGLRKKMLDQRLAFRKYYKQSHTTEKNAFKNPELKTLSSYLRFAGNYPVYENCTAKYFPLGDDLYPDLIAELEKAKHFIFMEYFIIAKGSVWDGVLDVLKRKAAEGVEIRVLYDGTNMLINLPGKYQKQLEQYGIKAKIFSPIMPLLSTHQNNRDHRKICVIDGRVGYNGGINLADEYMNRIERFGHWKDCAVKVAGPAVNSYTVMFLQMWNVAKADIEPEDAAGKQQPEDYNQYLKIEEQEAADQDLTMRKGGFVIPYADEPMDGELSAENVYKFILNTATDYVHIMTPYFIVDDGMVNALTFAAKRGVDVKLIVPHIPDKKTIFSISRTFYPTLLNAGVGIYEYTPGFVHSKVFVSDHEKAVVGSVNLDYRSFYHHFENATYFHENPVIQDIEDDFRNTLGKCQRVDMMYYKSIPLLERSIGRVCRLFGPLM